MILVPFLVHGRQPRESFVYPGVEDTVVRVVSLCKVCSTGLKLLYLSVEDITMKFAKYVLYKMRLTVRLQFSSIY